VIHLEKAVEVRDVKKIFITKKKRFFRTIDKKEFRAVDGISFDIYKGEIFGLLGPNGAGKTTTIKMITGILEPTSGDVRLCNIDVNKNPIEALKKIGVVLAGDRSIYWKLTGRENLEYFAALYGMSPKTAREKATRILKDLQMEDKADVLVEKYSTGMKQKIALGKALIPDAPVILLDEPTLGLDPQSALNLREIILELKRSGKTILLTTHYMEEADFLCDRIAIVDGGKIVALDTSANLKGSINTVKLIDIQVSNIKDELLEELKKIDRVQKVIKNYNDDKRLYDVSIHHTSGDEIVQAIINSLTNHSVKVININVKEPSLEDVFINLTGKELRI
jgi:ABC-2 type transport system ATP-binding protein